ncbi:hypothetical protein BC830DRAFT_1157927 [Chytriomyces sp. MP71]|nr:hypothetical protein BC830DRAFT_1157927 [Chytriomyces sp. MP71]
MSRQTSLHRRRIFHGINLRAERVIRVHDGQRLPRHPELRGQGVHEAANGKWMLQHGCPEQRRDRMGFLALCECRGMWSWKGGFGSWGCGCREWCAVERSNNFLSQCENFLRQDNLFWFLGTNRLLLLRCGLGLLLALALSNQFANVEHDSVNLRDSQVLALVVVLLLLLLLYEVR